MHKIVTKTLKQKIRKFATFLTGIEGRFVLSYVKCPGKMLRISVDLQGCFRSS